MSILILGVWVPSEDNDVQWGARYLRFVVAIQDQLCLAVYFVHRHAVDNFASQNRLLPLQQPPLATWRDSQHAKTVGGVKNGPIVLTCRHPDSVVILATAP